MEIIMLLTILLPVIIITAVTPYITRKTETFGITIPSDMYHDPRFVLYRKKYAMYSLALGVLLLGLLLTFSNSAGDTAWAFIFSGGVFAYIIATFIVYLNYHKKMKQLKNEEKWFEKKKEMIVIDTKFYKEKKVYSNAWFLIPLLITAGNIVFTFMNYDRFPEKLPMQYNFKGEVTTWADKSIGTLIMFALLQLFMTGMFLFINIIIARSKQLIDPANPEESVAQNLIFRRRWSLFTIISSIALVILFTVTNLSSLYKLDVNLLMAIILTITGLIVLGALLITLLTGQGGSRIKVGLDKNGSEIHRDEDKYWKLGIFYFNPDDPALFVEKRFGSGWTSNFARPIVWVIFLGIIAIPIAIAFLS